MDANYNPEQQEPKDSSPPQAESLANLPEADPVANLPQAEHDDNMSQVEPASKRSKQARKPQVFTENVSNVYDHILPRSTLHTTTADLSNTQNIQSSANFDGGRDVSSIAHDSNGKPKKIQPRWNLRCDQLLFLGRTMNSKLSFKKFAAPGTTDEPSPPNLKTVFIVFSLKHIHGENYSESDQIMSMDIASMKMISRKQGKKPIRN